MTSRTHELTRVVPDGDARSRRLWAIQALLPVALEEFVKEMHREFEELTGPRYERTGGQFTTYRRTEVALYVRAFDEVHPRAIPLRPRRTRRLLTWSS